MSCFGASLPRGFKGRPEGGADGKTYLYYKNNAQEIVLCAKCKLILNICKLSNCNLDFRTIFLNFATVNKQPTF